MQESIAFNLADGGDDWVDEESALDPLGHGFSALAAERHATEVGGVALRFGLFYGPGSSHSRMLIDCARRHLGFVAGSPRAFQPAIHLHDAAWATVAALSVPSGKYVATDDEPLTRRDFVRALGDAVGVTRLVRAPGSAARLGGRYTHSLTRSHRTSNARFAAAAGWHPEYPSVREGWQATVATMPRRDL